MDLRGDRDAECGPSQQGQDFPCAIHERLSLFGISFRRPTPADSTETINRPPTTAHSEDQPIVPKLALGAPNATTVGQVANLSRQLLPGWNLSYAASYGRRARRISPSRIAPWRASAVRS